ncbi:hypothetical protein OIU84_023437 [Salix udensis]|uniref:Uncharacterized protein n=1 Tax=Salix udensis TaxID=889485 RepID=A0AAD6PGY4_9ROSI|nr:hypothetical protein OIU84_023437 [Salix udensis]
MGMNAMLVYVMAAKAYLQNLPDISAKAALPSQTYNIVLAVTHDAYGLHIISIGPLPHGEQGVVAMEVHKLHYMLSFLARTPARAKHPDEYGKAILPFDTHIRACYAEPIDEYSGNDLAKMLLVDGYFILRIFLRFFMANLREDVNLLFNV